jgi:type I restriction-modification system DNA methylase subunit
MLMDATTTIMDQSHLNWIANFIWGIADDVLRGLYVRGKYRDVILPMTVLHRLDAGHRTQGHLRDDKRWQYGAPPAGNTNFAWVQHIVHHLAPAGVAGFVLANGSMSSNLSGEGEAAPHIETEAKAA